MRSESQRQASRNNGKKSKGPTTREGKDKVKFNGLKHGLRSNQVVLPGESAAEFNAELKGWADDWKPTGHTAAVLVERAAVASWRLRRCVRAEAGMLLELAAKREVERPDNNDDDGVDDELRETLDVAEDALDTDPAGALAELRSTPEGVDRLLRLWDHIAEALQREWDDEAHEALMPLLGHRPDADAVAAGPLAEDSHRLVLDRHCRYTRRGDDLLTDDEERQATARLGRGVADERAALRALRRELAAARPDLDDTPSPEPEATFAGVTPGLMLMHRYEMAHERSMRAAIKDLVALRKAGIGGGPAVAVVTEAVDIKEIKEKNAGPESGSEPGSPAAPSEPEPVGVAGRPGGVRRGRRRRSRSPRRPGGGRTAS